jgi:O-antigen ligase
LQTDLYFILAVFVAFSILNAKINLNLFFSGLRLALILLGVCHLSSINCSNIYISISAPVTILMMFLSIINFDNDSTANKILGLIAFMFGLMISVKSGIRLSWLIFAVLAVIFIVFTLKEKQVFKSFTMMTLFVVFVGGIVFSISNSQKIDNRITLTANEISAWSDASHKFSSIGLRLEMYKSSIEAFEEKPLFGHGYLMGTKVTAKYVDESLENMVFGFVQLHSEYVTTLVEKGLIGLMATGFLLLLPLLVAIRNYDINNIFIRIGLVTSISFILFGTFNVSFGDTTYKALYVFLICLYLPKIYKKS